MSSSEQRVVRRSSSGVRVRELIPCVSRMFLPVMSRGEVEFRNSVVS